MKFNNALAKEIEGKPEFNFLKDVIGKEITMADVRLYTRMLASIFGIPRHCMWKIIASQYLSYIPKYKVLDAYNSELIGYAKNLSEVKRMARDYEVNECDGEEAFIVYKTYNKKYCRWENPEML